MATFETYGSVININKSEKKHARNSYHSFI